MENAGPKIVALIVIMFLGIGLAGYLKDTLGTKSDDPNIQEQIEEQERELSRDKHMAYEVSKGFVRQKLKAPSTAKFPSPWKFSTEDNVKYNGGGVYIVSGYVDSENAFGAMVRTRFNAKVKQNSQHSWDLVSLTLEH